MSAYIVPMNHIHAIVNFAYRSRDSAIKTVEQATMIGQAFVDANYKSVNFRYRKTVKPQKPEVYKFPEAEKPRISPVQCLKAINCLEYQSCEFPDWEKSGARKELNKILHLAIYSLPGYEEAAWTID